MNKPRETLPVAALERIDDACLEFERVWRGGQQPEIEPALAKAASAEERAALLAELLALDMDYRHQRGEQPTTQEYCRRFPEDESLVRQALRNATDASRPSKFEPPSVEYLSQVFPELEILEHIGSGGMGAVYKARQKGLDRLVALKILPDEVAQDVKFALRFTREARALARLSHPHIVSVYEFGNTEGTYYFLMEYVDGSTLREVIQAGELSPQQALAIVPCLCDALQYAHDQGVVHRDIKPENILIDQSGQVKVADFGLSRLLGDDSQEDALTATHQVMGTIRYMAPEQLEGAHHVDHRADIYSLGVVFYEMLTGELPLGRFAAPSKKVHIDVRLDDVVLRTLEKEPQRRYQRASQVKSDLESIVHPADPSSPGSETTPQAVRESTPPEAGRPSLEKQEMAARVLLLRRELMVRVASALKPLFWGQILQILAGVGVIALGVFCWAPNTDVPHRLFSGISLHVYGALMIIVSGITCEKIRRLDYSKPVDDIRRGLHRIREHYLRYGAMLGFSWWLLWLPVTVAIGLDAVVYPPALWISIGISLSGLVASWVLYTRVLRSPAPWAQKWQRSLAGESLTSASQALEEIAKTEMS